MEPQLKVTEDMDGGPFGEVAWLEKGPVNVTVYRVPDSENPTTWGRELTEDEAKAYELGEVYSFWINYHDGEADVSGDIYGWSAARKEALEGLEHAWERFQRSK